MKTRRWRRRLALPVAGLLLLAAPLLNGAIPTDVIRVEDPEPLPDAPQKRVTPATPDTLPSPAIGTPQAPLTPDNRSVQPAPSPIAPEHATPPIKAPAAAPK